MNFLSRLLFFFLDFSFCVFPFPASVRCCNHIFIPSAREGERSSSMGKKRTIDGIIKEKISLLTDFAIVSKANKDKYTALFEYELEGMRDINMAQMKADRIALNFIEQLFEF